jgi:quinol-cytochrome oxidoreductase complex cytochrome b subunit
VAAGTTARRVLAQAAVFLLVVLATTGVWLTFTYAPGREQALGLSAHPAVSPTRWLHRLAGLALVPVCAGVAVTSLRRRWGAGAVLLAIVLALVWSGFLLPWDQLVLSASRTADRFRGMITAAFDANVEVVRIGGREVGQGAFRARLVTHAAVLPVALAVTSGVTARVLRRRRSATGGRPPPRGRSDR